MSIEMNSARSVAETIKQSVDTYGSETGDLIPVVERRYDRSLFLSTGQYDWFSAQVLYCLIRHIKPQTVIEVSSSSGYSTVIQALALKENGCGVIHTFEIDRKLAAWASAALRQFHVDDFVEIHVGDARIESDRLDDLTSPVLLFLDSLHTEKFARWFIDRWVTRVPPETLFHVHDVMPPTARVRFDGSPPWNNRTKGRVLDVGRLCLGRPTPESLGYIKPDVFPPATRDGRPTTNGVFLSEAAFINRLVQKMPAGTFAYLYLLADEYPQLSPRRFDSLAIKREDSAGKPMEWNEAVWLYSGEVCKALHQIEPS